MAISDLWSIRSIYFKSKQQLFKGPFSEPLRGLLLAILYIPTYIVRCFCTWKHSDKKVTAGVNLIGFAKDNFGLAEHLRFVANAINTSTIAFCVNNFKKHRSSTPNKALEAFIIEDNPFLINLFCINSDYILDYMASAKGGVALKKHYNIGYGYWELSKYPSEWTAQNSYLQEIWAPTTFIKEVLEASTKLPVYYMPIAVDFELPKGYARSSFQLPEEAFVFLFTFDMSSSVVRKNPQAVIDAFTQAFPMEKKDTACLVIKINRIKTDAEHSKKVEALRVQVRFDSRIIILDEVVDRPSILGLIGVCDAYISLHRSEGFGLGMAEAMKMGKVVIATNYSGNTDFMNETNSCPVNYTRIEVKKSEFVHVEEGAMWADPDVGHAAYFMRKVYDDPAFCKTIGQAAKAYIEHHHSFATIGALYQQRIAAILKANAALVD